MTVIKVVENPRRKGRSRRTYSAKQRQAGFGGKRRMSGRKSTSRRTTRRRRNPMMAALGNPRRRRTYHKRPRYTVTGVSRPRRRRNPRLGPFSFNLMTAVWIGTGVLSTEIVPRVVKRFWAGIPTSGPAGYLVKAGVAFGSGMIVGKFSNKQNGALVTAGGLAMIFVDLFRQYALPKIPYLSGMAGDDSLVVRGDIEDLAGYVETSENLAGFVEAPSPLQGYVDNPAGAYG